VHEVLASPGLPLETSTRQLMESRLNHDFSQVRVHTDARARDSARAVTSSAYTVGSDIVFAPGQYQPRSFEGRKLLAHELAHVMQNAGSGPGRGSLTLGAVNSVEERQADAIADRVERPSSNLPRHHVGSTQNILRRQASTGSSSACADDAVGLVSLRAPTGRDYVEKARDRLLKFVAAPVNLGQTNADPDSQRAAQALYRHFAASGPKAVEAGDRIAATLHRMSNKLGALDTPAKVRSEVSCHSSTEPVCQIADAYIDRSAVIPHFNLCPSFSQGSEETRQVEILIHESAHAADIQISDRAYLSQRFYRLLDTPAALANAESYSTFVMELALGGNVGNYKFPVDDLRECKDRTLQDTMAYAEHWNWAALSAMADPNFMEFFGQILWSWGLANRSGNGFAPIGNILQRLVNTYQEAQDKFFSSKRTIRCTTSDEVCQTRYGAILKDNQLIVCTTGPTAQPPNGCPGCVLGLLYAGLGGQLVTKAVAIATDIASITDAPRRSAKMNSNLDAEDRKRPEVKRGDHGCPIPELQEKLREANGTRFKVSGKFDAETENAVIAFQESMMLIKAGARRGEADEKTWTALHQKIPGEHGLPQGETFAGGKEGGWGKRGDVTQFDWYQILTPVDTDFSGCWVKEMAPQIDPSENTCCTVGPCPGSLTGGAWRVDDKNTYGPDTVGISKDVVDALRTRRKAPCGYVVPQAMAILRDSRDMQGVGETDRDNLIAKSKNAESAEYVRNELLYKVTDDDIRCGKRNKYGLAKSATKYP